MKVSISSKIQHKSSGENTGREFKRYIAETVLFDYKELNNKRQSCTDVNCMSRTREEKRFILVNRKAPLYISLLFYLSFVSPFYFQLGASAWCAFILK